MNHHSELTPHIVLEEMATHLRKDPLRKHAQSACLVLFASFFLQAYGPPSPPSQPYAIKQNPIWKLKLAPLSGALPEDSANLRLEFTGDKVSGSVRFLRSAGTVTGRLVNGEYNIEIPAPDGVLHLKGVWKPDEIDGLFTESPNISRGQFRLIRNQLLSGNEPLPSKWKITLHEKKAARMMLDPLDEEPSLNLVKTGNRVQGTASYVEGWCGTGPRHIIKVNVTGDWSLNNHVDLRFEELYNLSGIYDPKSRTISGTQVETGHKFTMDEIY